jgi:hypothetical protein
LILLDVRENSAAAMAFWRRVKHQSPRQRILILGRPFLVHQEDEHPRAA